MSPAASALTIRVNGEPRSLARPATLHDLVCELGLADRKGVAVAVNDAVAPRASWATHALADGDRVILIRAAQGG